MYLKASHGFGPLPEVARAKLVEPSKQDVRDFEESAIFDVAEIICSFIHHATGNVRLYFAY